MAASALTEPARAVSRTVAKPFAVTRPVDEMVAALG